MPLKLSNFSDAQWDQFVAGHPHGHVLQSSAWGAFKARHGWRPLRVALADETGQPITGAQLLLRQMPLATVAYCPRGPVARPADLSVLLPHVHAAARRAGAVFLKVEPAWEGDQNDVWQAHGFNVAQTVQPPSTIVLDLTQTEDQLLAAMKQKWRYNIRLAAKKGVVVREATEADLSAWYALMEVTGVRDGFGIHAADYYTDGFRLFCDGQRGVLLIAEYAGEMLGGVMIFAFGPEAIYMYGASGNAYRNLMPNHALQWAAIRWAKARGCARYDFWGIPPEATEGEETPEDGGRKTEDGRQAEDGRRKTNGRGTEDSGTPDDGTSSSVLRPPPAPGTGGSSGAEGGLWGVYRFKQGFGGRTVRYAGAFDYVYNTPFYWAGTSLLPRLRTWARRGRREAAAQGA